MLERQELSSKKVKVRCRPRSLMHALIDFDAKKDKTLLRDRVCEAILHKRSVLGMLEHHAYHIFSRSEPGKPRNLGALLDFAVLYGIERYEETHMKQEDDERMVKTPRWLGENIAEGVLQAALSRNESPGRSRGVFFRLRKTRTTKDFLDE